MDAAAKTDLADVWRQRITAQQSAEESIRDWCKSNGCHEHAFYWWRARLGLSPVSGPKRRRRVVQPKFAEVVVDGPVERPAVAERFEAGIVAPILLRLGGGRELVLPVSMADERVAALVRLIEGKSPAIEERS